MAERRMFAKSIIDSDAFLDMPLSTQALYFHLSMRADDDGFVNNPKKITRLLGCGDDDAKLLLAKKFIISFESGVIVIKHWKIHNYIQKDRYKKTNYHEEMGLLSIDENNGYSLDTKCVQLGDAGKVRGRLEIGKVSKEISNFDIPSCIEKNSWNEWVSFRKQIKKSLTDLTIKKQIKFLVDCFNKGQNPNLIIEQSIANGWTGLFELKLNSKQSYKDRCINESARVYEAPLDATRPF